MQRKNSLSGIGQECLLHNKLCVAIVTRTGRDFVPPAVWAVPPVEPEPGSTVLTDKPKPCTI